MEEELSSLLQVFLIFQEPESKHNFMANFIVMYHNNSLILFLFFNCKFQQAINPFTAINSDLMGQVKPISMIFSNLLQIAFNFQKFLFFLISLICQVDGLIQSIKSIVTMNPSQSLNFGQVYLLPLNFSIKVFRMSNYTPLIIELSSQINLVTHY